MICDGHLNELVRSRLYFKLKSDLLSYSKNDTGKKSIYT